MKIAALFFALSPLLLLAQSETQESKSKTEQHFHKIYSNDFVHEDLSRIDLLAWQDVKTHDLLPRPTKNYDLFLGMPDPATPHAIPAKAFEHHWFPLFHKNPCVFQTTIDPVRGTSTHAIGIIVYRSK